MEIYPEGKKTTAGEVVDDPQPCPQRLPVEMAALDTVVTTQLLSQCDERTYLIAAVSSVTPSPTAPKSFTFRKTWKVLGSELYGAVPYNSDTISLGP